MSLNFRSIKRSLVSLEDSKYGETFREKVADFFFYKIFDPVETCFWKTFYGVQNLWKWLPIVWGDRDWDYAFLFYMMEFKLKNMADAIEEEDRHVGVVQDVKDMRTCAFLLKRLTGDETGLVYHKDSQLFSEEFYQKRLGMGRRSDRGYLKMFAKIFGRKVQHWWS